MVTGGGTLYFDAAKTWSGSILARYETHSEKHDSDIDYRPGDNFHFEWGLGKNIAKKWDVGLAGYCSWQVTDDTANEPLFDPGDRNRVFAAGPEIAFFEPSILFMASLRTEWEFEAQGLSEGNITTLTLTKGF